MQVNILTWILSSPRIDTAYTSKQENDPSAISIWGIWQKSGLSATSMISSHLTASNVVDMMGRRIQIVDERDTIPCAMLMDAKEFRLPLHGEDTLREQGESQEAYFLRAKAKVGAY
jgi:hypothetical protein